MDLEFHKKSLPYLQTIANKAQTQEQTQEVRLPEGMPDIGNVVCSWAQVILRGKEWRGDRIGVNGGVMTWVMYLSEDENTPHAMAAWIPFQMKWDIPQTQHDGTILLRPFLRSVDARSLSARKILVRSTFGVDMEAVVPGIAEVYEPGELPEDIRILQKNYPVCLPQEAGEKPYSIEETFTVSGTLPKPEQLIRYELRPQITEWKIMTDKLVFRGVAVIHALYRCSEGNLHTWHQEVALSQFADLDKEYDDCCKVQTDCIVTDLELDVLEDGQFSLKAGLSCQYMVYAESMLHLVEDAYSSMRQISPKMGQLQIPGVLDHQTENLRVEQTVEADAAHVIDLAFYADHPQKIREKDSVQVQIPGVFSLLYTDPEGGYQSTNAYWEETLSLPADESSGVSVTAVQEGSPVSGISSNGVSMQSNLLVDWSVVAGEGLPMVTGLEVGEDLKKDPNRPSLILRRAGEDTLWQIAKETGTTMENIQIANHLTGEPMPNQMLLIPIP